MPSVNRQLQQDASVGRLLAVSAGNQAVGKYERIAESERDDERSQYRPSGPLLIA